MPCPNIHFVAESIKNVKLAFMRGKKKVFADGMNERPRQAFPASRGRFGFRQL